jgi:hypothetical protein
MAVAAAVFVFMRVIVLVGMFVVMFMSAIMLVCVVLFVTALVSMLMLVIIVSDMIGPAFQTDDGVNAAYTAAVFPGKSQIPALKAEFGQLRP